MRNESFRVSVSFFSLSVTVTRLRKYYFQLTAVNVIVTVVAWSSISVDCSVPFYIFCMSIWCTEELNCSVCMTVFCCDLYFYWWYQSVDQSHISYILFHIKYTLTTTKFLLFVKTCHNQMSSHHTLSLYTIIWLVWWWNICWVQWLEDEVDGQNLHLLVLHAADWMKSAVDSLHWPRSRSH